MRNYKLTTEELGTIKEAMNHARQPEVRQRAAAIHLLHKGHSAQNVADMLAVSVGSIYSWHDRWQKEGIEGLRNRPKSGRPTKADDNYRQVLEEALEKEPKDYGYAFGFWTADRLREHMRQQTGIALSNRRFRALLKKHDYVYRRPKHDLSHLQDAALVEQAEALIEWLKKPVSQDNINSSLWTKQP